MGKKSRRKKVGANKKIAQSFRTSPAHLKALTRKPTWLQCVKLFPRDPRRKNNAGIQVPLTSTSQPSCPTPPAIVREDARHPNRHADPFQHA